MLQSHAVASVALIVKEGNEHALTLGDSIQAWLTKQHVPVHYCLHTYDSPKPLPQVDLVVALGGDGTLVSLAGQLLGSGVPLAGVNFGRVGFLAELSPNNWERPLQRALEKGVCIESRMTLECTVMRHGATLCSGEVVNDVVITRGRLARLVQLDLHVDGDPFFTLRSDGIIASTPTGSTGYSGSAGGPILMPTLNSYVIAAICPFLSNFPPMVFQHDTVFSVVVGEAAADLYLTLDGHAVYELEVGDTIKIKGNPGRFFMARMGEPAYFQRLQQVGLIQNAGTRQIGEI